MKICAKYRNSLENVLFLRAICLERVIMAIEAVDIGDKERAVKYRLKSSVTGRVLLEIRLLISGS
ncbi:hypothetical protein HDE69_005260 [Pedobacter cryoconitis]|uniref:Uncharacterized protein n=1 Tax=Pedobacter cryoconitis TaxID=188932 RepID=A0A7W8YZ34_9SPHI|nr:hypothetical protein [Pedobacter cryoconitis]MBB5624163.1 hypothetical protein [Pedobacter cryoconitis]MBB5647408.1 hypothetical protein [Pedobacter cryoconitis]